MLLKTNPQKISMFTNQDDYNYNRNKMFGGDFEGYGWMIRLVWPYDTKIHQKVKDPLNYVPYMALNKKSTQFLLKLRQNVDNKMNEGIKILEQNQYDYSDIITKIFNID